MAFITVAGQSKIALKQGLEQVLNITHFVFANIAGLGAEPVNRIESMPISGNIVHTAAVAQSGYVNPNQVVYSAVLDSNVGNFDYNWIGLKDEGNTLIAVVYLGGVFHKTANNGGIAGNNVTRNFLLEYNGITATTAIAVHAETWQIDFTARLWGIDERERLSNFDIYGAGSFFGTGFSLTHLSGNNYQVEPGLGYVGGIRLELAAAHALTIATKPMAVWVDASLQGNVSDVTAVYSFVISNSVQANYTDSYGFKHFLYKIGTVNADSTVTNERIITGSTLDFATKSGVQNAAYSHANASGTANAITATFLPAVTSLVDGMTLFVVANSANTTTAPTFSPSGLIAKPIAKSVGVALLAGDIEGNGHILELKYRSNIQKWILQNPKASQVQAADTVFGPYISLAALQAAHSTATAGDLAEVDTGSSDITTLYAWDAQSGWVETNVDANPKLTTKNVLEHPIRKYFTQWRVLNTPIGALLNVSVAILGTDTIRVVLNKLIKQVTSLSSGEHLGTYVSLAALQAAYPTTTASNQADVDTGGGSPAVLYIYDAQDGWVVPAGSSGVTLSYLTNALSGYVKNQTLTSILLNYAPKVQPYETGGFYIGKPPVSTVVYAKPFSIPVTFPANLAGSLVYCEGAAATANTIFNLKKNGTSVGSMTIGAGSRTATFSLIGGVSFAAGDRLTVVSPATQDATLEGLSFSLIGER